MPNQSVLRRATAVLSLSLCLVCTTASSTGYAASVPPVVRGGNAPALPPPPVSSTEPCTAERSTTGNSQVNCARADTGIVANLQLDQSEPSIVAVGNKLVAAFNDAIGIPVNPGSAIGYSVSHDGDVTWIDMGSPPLFATIQPASDPSLAIDDQGNVWLAVMVLDRPLNTTPIAWTFKLALYEMPAGSDTFSFISTPVVAPQGILNMADKELLAVGRDGQGREHLLHHVYLIAASRGALPR